MKLYVLFGQLREGYPGQYTPCALDVMSEFAYDESPDFLNGELEKARKTGDFSALKIIPLQVSMEAIQGALTPKLTPIPAMIVREEL